MIGAFVHLRGWLKRQNINPNDLVIQISTKDDDTRRKIGEAIEGTLNARSPNTAADQPIATYKSSVFGIRVEVL